MVIDRVGFGFVEHRGHPQKYSEGTEGGWAARIKKKQDLYDFNLKP